QPGALASPPAQGTGPSWYKEAADVAKAPAMTAAAGGGVGGAAKPGLADLGMATNSMHSAPTAKTAAFGSAPIPKTAPTAAGTSTYEAPKINAKTRHIIEKALVDFNAKAPSYSINRPHVAPTLIADPKPMGSANLVFSHAD
ncbi:MAG: hypothetical protein H7287_01480, partial [Thermoleophilia bacterium]|nr:hypothetical protein [Thermoleophilia bacterium]